MENNRIIQRGEEAKFLVAIRDYDMEAGDFRVELIYGYRRTVVTIEKSQMAVGSGGDYYFTFDTDDIVGRVTARCVWMVVDLDCDDGQREHYDEQVLCFVVDVPCPKFAFCPASCDDHEVTYERTDESNVASKYNFLLTSRGDRIMTDDDLFVLVLKEGIDPDAQESNDEETDEP